ncbi:MAG: BatD family protein [Methylococcales bacterium]
MKTLFFLLILLNSTLVMATEITVAIDRDPVNLNESFQLTYTANKPPDGEPDFEPLTQDFEILNKYRSGQSSLFNGNSSANIQWTVRLMAKKAGSLVVPSIAFGKDKTETVSLLVTQPKLNTNEGLLLKLEASPLNPYVQSQVLLKVLFYRNVRMRMRNFEAPKIDDVVIQKLDDIPVHNEQVNGVDYTVTGYNFVIFPQKSGALNIKPSTLRAEIQVIKDGDYFLKEVQIASNPIKLDVRPAPANLKLPHWLPAEDLQLKQEWSGDTANMKVGEPLTRTLAVEAKGATVGLLPELNKPSTDQQLKIYPDQPTLKEMPKPEGIYALREEKIAIIPSSAGSFTLPAIEVPWFNTQTQKVQVATIPAVTLTVLAPATGVNSPAAPTLAPVVIPSATGAVPAPEQSLAILQSNPWVWATVCLGLGWLSTVIYLLVKRKSLKPVKLAEKAPQISNNATQLLKQACQSNNPQLAKQALLHWGVAEFKVNNLGALAVLCGTRLRDEIQQLNQFLYAPHNNPAAVQQWQGKQLLQAFNEHGGVHKKQPDSKDDKLEPLYRL